MGGKLKGGVFKIEQINSICQSARKSPERLKIQGMIEQYPRQGLIEARKKGLNLRIVQFIYSIPDGREGTFFFFLVK